MNAPVIRDGVKITAAIATYNEEQHIGRCLEGLLAQQGADDIEILVIDGMSSDRTADIVHSFARLDSRVRLLQNPRRLQVFAWNIALQEARGTYFAMILGHAEYDPTYFASCLETLDRTGAAAVGGVQRPYGSGLLGRAIAWCMSSSLGMGNARFRYTREEEETDSVFSIFTKTERLRAIGGYDESIPFDEDSDLNYRLRQNGGKLIVSPSIRVRYHVRRSLRALSKQMFCYGFWRRYTQVKHRGAVPLRVLAPAFLVAGLAVSALLACTHFHMAAALVPGAYAAFLGIAGVSAIRRAGVAAALVPVALCTMHLSYGAGWWKAFLKRPNLQPAAGI